MVTLPPFAVIAFRMEPSLRHALVNERSRPHELGAFPSVLGHQQVPTGFAALADFADDPHVLEVVDHPVRHGDEGAQHPLVQQQFWEDRGDPMRLLHGSVPA